jgi:hypothetical protein
MRKRYYLLFIFFLMACEESPTNSCDMEDCTSGLGNQMEWDQDHVHRYYPCFNPNNPDELIYIRKAYQGGNENYGLIKYNLVTHTSDTLLAWQNDLAFMVYPEWGRQGYITYGNISNQQAFLLNSTDHNLTQLTSTNQNYYPGWNYNGNKILYSKNTGGEYVSVLMDLAGNSLDTIPDDPTNASLTKVLGLSNGHFLCLFGNTYIYEYDQNLDFVGKFEPQGYSGFFIVWDVDYVSGANKVAWANSQAGVCVTDLSTHSTSIIYPNCAMRSAGPISVSPSGNQLLVSITKYEKINSCYYKYVKEIHLMNIDGTNDQVLSLP